MTPAQYLALTSGYGGWCLKWVRLALGVPAKHATAYDAWRNAAHQRTDRTPPAGVPVFFAPTKNGFGHVAYSLGGGRIRTTNAVTQKIYNTTIDALETGWGQAYLGWTEDLNGVRVHTARPAPAPAPAPGVERRREVYQVGDWDYPEVEELQRVLNAWYPALPPLKVDGDYGHATAGRVEYFQRAAGLEPDMKAGPITLARLGIR